MKRTRERITRRKAEKIHLLPHHRTREVLVKYNVSQAERAAHVLFNGYKYETAGIKCETLSADNK